ncbi:MAG TPA: GTPase RsgA, partial [Acidimicrobiales bacterium]
LQRTQDLREADQRGRHTTTAGQLVVLPEGGILVDTPGVKAVGLWDDGDGLEQVFADIDALALECRFADCQHAQEPGCAVREAVPTERIESWRKLRRELARTAGDRKGWEVAESRRQLRVLHRSRRGATYRP